jgi:DNA polymerase-3 subunit gamma/tau
MELYKTHRPKQTAEVVGQEKALAALRKMVKAKAIPHALLFTGPSGCGKTTLGRIVTRALKCDKIDFQEVNCADFRGIEMVRSIRKRMDQAPMGGDARVWLIDEAHKLSNDAQNAFLKLLEDTPQHVYFMLATTEPNKLIKTIRTRCTEVGVKALSEKHLISLCNQVLVKEGIENFHDDVLEKIAEHSEGSARKALVLLDQVYRLEDKKEMLDAIESTESKTDSIKIARMLMNTRTTWKQMAALLKDCDLSEPEGLRRMIIGYCKSVMLGNGPLTQRAFVVLDTFKDHMYDCGASGIVWGCYAVINGE